MEKIFTLIIPTTAYRYFVQDWIQTVASTWKNVNVTHFWDGVGQLCTVRITVQNSKKCSTYIHKNLFGSEGELTKKYWCLYTSPD